MDGPPPRSSRTGDDDWRSAVEERTRLQEASRRRYGRWLIGIAVALGLVVAAGLFGPADNRAALHALWSPPPEPAPPATSPTGDEPLIDHGDIQFASEIIEFISPHGSTETPAGRSAGDD